MVTIIERKKEKRDRQNGYQEKKRKKGIRARLKRETRTSRKRKEGK